MRQRSTGGVSSSSNSSADLNPQQTVIQEYVDRLKGSIAGYGEPEAVLSQKSKEILHLLRSTLDSIHVQEKPNLDAEYTLLDAQLDRLRNMLLEDLNAVFWGSSRYSKTDTFRQEIGNARWDMQLDWNMIPKEKSSEAVLTDNAQITLDQLAASFAQQSSEQSKQLAELAQKTDADHKQLAEGLQNTVKKEDLDGFQSKITGHVQESIGKLEKTVDGKLEKEKREHQQQWQSVLAENRELNQQVVLYKQEVSTVKQTFEVALQDQNRQWQAQMEKAMVAALAETHRKIEMQSAKMETQAAEMENMRVEIETLRQQLRLPSSQSSQRTTMEPPIIDINRTNDNGFIDLSQSCQVAEKPQARRIDMYVTAERVKLVDIYSEMQKQNSTLYQNYTVGLNMFLCNVLSDLDRHKLDQFINEAKTFSEQQPQNPQVFARFCKDMLDKPYQKEALVPSDQAFISLLRRWQSESICDNYQEKEAFVKQRLKLEQVPSDVVKRQTKMKMYNELIQSQDIILPAKIKAVLQEKYNEVSYVPNAMRKN